MNAQHRHPSVAALAVATLALAIMLPAPSLQAATADAKARQLAGTWDITATFVNCTTGASLGPAFGTLHTYLPNGSLLEQGSRVPTDARARTVGQGVWESEGGGRFRATYKFFRFGAEGNYLGYSLITRDITVGTRGDFFVGAGVVKGFDANGNQVGGFCIVESATRMTVED